MSTKLLKVRSRLLLGRVIWSTYDLADSTTDLLTLFVPVIARNALAQEESEEFSGDFSDPIDIHIDRDNDGCAC